MTITEHPANQHTTTMKALGMPGVDGRWQPTRAGAVNSWAWGQETLLFADGWLALAGPNGSGKSLTASMLITLLLDANTTQKALSVSGKAAGTLISRHTDRKESEDRTGAWWLEYGRRDATTGQVEYVTTGLWLRATSGDLERAFFVVPGRVGHEVILEADRETLRIAQLAEHLAGLGGQLFTSIAKVRSQIPPGFPASGDERDYRNVVRTRLFAPLDEVQFDALVGVLRSLRSLRTAEAIPPDEMRQTLTKALPALDPDGLALIAETMERISDLETQLQRTREEAALLTGTDSLYSRYLTVVARVEAAQLAAANHDYAGLAVQGRDAQTALDAANARLEATQTAQERTRLQIAELQGRKEAAEASLRDHAGAELELRARRADELAEQAEQAAERAEQARQDADSATQTAGISAKAARTAQEHLTGLSDALRGQGGDVGAEAALERLLAAAGHLASAAPDNGITLNLDQLSATPIAWTEARLAQVAKVRTALEEHRAAQADQKAAAGIQRRADDHVDQCRDEAEATTTARQDSETALAEAVSGWAAGAHHFGPVPPSLLTTHDDGERLALDRLLGWVDQAARHARTGIDLNGHRQRAAAASATAAETQRTAQQLRTDHGLAHAALIAARTAFEQTQQQAEHERAAARERTSQARTTHDNQLAAAHTAVAAAVQRRDDSQALLLHAVRDWISQVRAWSRELTHLPADSVSLSGDEVTDAELMQADPAAALLEATKAHAAVAAQLGRHIETAKQQREAAAEAVAAVEADIATARQSAPTPPEPFWRQRQPDSGSPLWALVDFAPHLANDDQDRLEGALLVSGLLDALLTPDGCVVTGDLTITGGPPVPGRSLADLLVVDPPPGVDASRVSQILRAIPVDAPGSELETGLLATGVVTAVAPAGYHARFIGRTARERARLARLAQLQQTLQHAQQTLQQAEENLRRREADVTHSEAELAAFPSGDGVSTARDTMRRCETALTQAQREGDAAIADAAAALQSVLAEVNAEEIQRIGRLATSHQRCEQAEKAESDADLKASEAEIRAEAEAETARHLQDLAEKAFTAEQEVTAQQQAFPHALLAQVRSRQQDEDAAEADLVRAQQEAGRATERHTEAANAVRDALRVLNKHASLPDGSLLPTDAATLSSHTESTSRLAHQVELWKSAADRTSIELGRAAADTATAKTRMKRAEAAAASAGQATQQAAREAAAVKEIRDLHGAAYQHLLDTRNQIELALGKAVNDAERQQKDREAAIGEASTAQATLNSIAPQRESAEQRREQCRHRLCRLIDEGLATVTGDVPTDEAGRPANLTAALNWARVLLSGHPAGPSRLDTLIQNRTRALRSLEQSQLATNTKLAPFNRQITLNGIDDTDWRRALVADPQASRGETLPLALKTLQATAAQLQDDLRDDFKQAMRTGLFTELRRDIQIRREAAQDLINRIRRTLATVRTGVAQVGIQVAWNVRDEPDAQRMVELIQLPPSDEVFAEMYDVLQQRMDNSGGETWAERVANTFDYRKWHTWEISVTHSSFTDATGAEKFRKIEARSNPLDTLSTGERRLATMLPLLAAAWSMYSGEYSGPRLISIDEIDAAFDENNLRQVLALLRDWDFDVLATTPSMAPLIKREAGRAVIHQVITTGRHRVTVPWLWEGHGDPQPLTLDLNPATGYDAPNGNTANLGPVQDTL